MKCYHRSRVWRGSAYRWLWHCRDCPAAGCLLTWEAAMDRANKHAICPEDIQHVQLGYGSGS